MPKVSVVLPTYNRAHTLPLAVQSVLKQTYVDFELIIVDDGSNDNTKEVVDSFADQRIFYIRHENNMGVAEARNTGIRASKAPYIAFQDSDDEWYLEKLMYQMEIMTTANEKVGVVYTSFLRERENGALNIIPENSIEKTEGDLSVVLLETNFVTLQAALIRKTCFEKAGYFDRALHILDDWEGLLRIAQLYEFRHLVEPMVVAHATLGNLTTKKSIRLIDREFLIKKHEALYVKHPAIYARMLYNLGYAFAIRGNRIKTIYYLSRSARMRPWRIRTIIFYLLAFWGLLRFFGISRNNNAI